MFGAGYLDTILTQEEAIASASEHISWDLEAQEVVAFLKRHALAEMGSDAA